MSSNYYAVVMAGGVGSRFWPVSTPEFPKQFHDMLGSGEILNEKLLLISFFSNLKTISNYAFISSLREYSP